jgi:uncharacterized Ntn-hydrolase superfamily protein
MSNNNKWYSPKAEEWYYRLQNDPDYLDREYYTDRDKWHNDRIDIHKSMIQDLELLYEQLPVTSSQSQYENNRVRIQDGIKQVEIGLAVAMAEYEEFKRHGVLNK